MENEERFSYSPGNLNPVLKKRISDSPQKGRLRGDPHNSSTHSGFSSDGNPLSSTTVDSTSSVLLPNRSGGEEVIEAMDSDYNTRSESAAKNEGADATVGSSRVFKGRNDKGGITTSGSGTRIGSGDVVLGSGGTILTNCTTITTLRNNTQTSVRVATEVSCQTNIVDECSRPLDDGSLATPNTGIQSSSSSGTTSDNTSTLDRGTDDGVAKNAVISKDSTSFGKPSILLFSSLPPINSDVGLSGKFPLADSVARNHKSTSSAGQVGCDGSYHFSSSSPHSASLTSNDGRTSSEYAMAPKKEAPLRCSSSASTFPSPTASFPSPLEVMSMTTAGCHLDVGGGWEDKEKQEVGNTSDDEGHIFYSSPSPPHSSSTTNFPLAPDAEDRKREEKMHHSAPPESPESASAPSSLIRCPRRPLSTALPEQRKRSPSLSKGFKVNQSRSPSFSPDDIGAESIPPQLPLSITNTDAESCPTTAVTSVTSTGRQGLFERRAKFDFTSLVTLSMENLHDEDNSPGVCLTSPVASFRGWFKIRSSAGGRPPPMSTVSSTGPAFGSMRSPAGSTLSNALGTVEPASPARGARGGAAGVRSGDTAHCPPDTPDFSNRRSSSSESAKRNRSHYGGAFLSGTQASNRTLKVVSYNILAQRFVSTDDYPTCPPSALTEEHRIPLLMKELRQAGADIIALSEISVRVFAGEPSLSVGHFLHHTLHYDGFHVANTTVDGTVVQQAKPYFSPSCCKRNCNSGNSNTEFGLLGMENALMTQSLPSSQLLTASAHDVPASPSHQPPTRMGQDHFAASPEDETDGIAIFFNHQRFEVLEAQPVYFNRIGAADTSLTPAERKALLVKTHNVGLVLALHDLWNPLWIYIVGTSHLIWRSEGQLWQLHQLLKAMEKMKLKYQQKRVASSLSSAPVAFSNGSFTSTSFHPLSSLATAAAVDKFGSPVDSSSVFSTNTGSSQYSSPLSRVRRQVTPPATLPPLSSVTKEMTEKGAEVKKGNCEEFPTSQEGGGGFAVTVVGGATRPTRSTGGGLEDVDSSPPSTIAGVPSSAMKTSQSSAGSYCSPTTPKQKTSSNGTPHVAGGTSENSPTMTNAGMKEGEGGPARSNVFFPTTQSAGTTNAYHVACILTGDFNMEPYHAALDYARTGLLRSDAEVCKAWRECSSSFRQSVNGLSNGAPSPSSTAFSTTSPTAIKVPNTLTSVSTSRSSSSVLPYNSFSSRKIQPLSVASCGTSASSGGLFTILPCSSATHLASVTKNRNACTLPPAILSPPVAAPSRAAGAAEEGATLPPQCRSSSSFRANPSLSRTSSDTSDGKDLENSPTAVLPHPLRSPSLRTTFPSSSSHPYVSLPQPRHFSIVYRTFGADTSSGNTPIHHCTMPTSPAVQEMASDSSCHSNAKKSSITEMSTGSISNNCLLPGALLHSASGSQSQFTSNAHFTPSITHPTTLLGSPSVAGENANTTLITRNTNSTVCNAPKLLSPSVQAITQSSGRSSFFSLSSSSSGAVCDAPAAPTKHSRNDTSTGGKEGTVKTIAMHRGYHTSATENLVAESPKSSREGGKESLVSVSRFSSTLEKSPTKLGFFPSVMGAGIRSILPPDHSQTPYFPLSLHVPGCYYPPSANGLSPTPPPSYPSPETTAIPAASPPWPLRFPNGPEEDSPPFMPQFHRSYGCSRLISGRALRAGTAKRENNKRRGSKKDGALGVLDSSRTAPLSVCLSEGGTEELYSPFALSARTTNANLTKTESKLIFQRCKVLSESCRQKRPRRNVSFSPPHSTKTERCYLPYSSSEVLPSSTELTIFTPTSPLGRAQTGNHVDSFHRLVTSTPPLSRSGTRYTSPSRWRGKGKEVQLGEVPKGTTSHLPTRMAGSTEEDRKDLLFPAESSREEAVDTTRPGAENLYRPARHTTAVDLPGTRKECPRSPSNALPGVPWHHTEREEGGTPPPENTPGIQCDANEVDSVERKRLPLSLPVSHPPSALPVSSIVFRLDALSLLRGPQASGELTASLSSTDSGNSNTKKIRHLSLTETCGSRIREGKDENEEEERAALSPSPQSSPSTVGGAGGKRVVETFPPLVALEGGGKGQKDGGGGRMGGEQQWGTMTEHGSASPSTIPIPPFSSFSFSSPSSGQKIQEGAGGPSTNSTSSSTRSMASPSTEKEVTLPELTKEEKGSAHNASTSSVHTSAGGLSGALLVTTPPLLPPYPPPPLPHSAAPLPFRLFDRSMIGISTIPSPWNAPPTETMHAPQEEEQNALLMDCPSPCPRRKKNKTNQHTTLQDFSTPSWLEEEEEKGSEASGGVLSGGGGEPFSESSSFMQWQDPGSPSPRKKRVQPIPPSTPPEGSRVRTGSHPPLPLLSDTQGGADVNGGEKSGAMGERNGYASAPQHSSTSGGGGGGLSPLPLPNASGNHSTLIAEPIGHASFPYPTPFPPSLSPPGPSSTTKSSLPSTRLYSSGETRSGPPSSLSSNFSTPHLRTAFSTPHDRKLEDDSCEKGKEEQMSFSNRLCGGGNKSGRVAISLHSHGHAIPKPLGGDMTTSATDTAFNAPSSNANGNYLGDGTSPAFLSTPPHPVASHQLRFHNVYETYLSKFPNHVTSSSGVNEGKVIDYILCDSVDLLVPESVVQLGEKTTPFPSWNCPSDHFMVGAIFSLQSPVAGAASSSSSSFFKASASSSLC